MDKKDYTMVTLTLALITSLGFAVMPSPTHFCDSRELNAYCVDLSSTGKTCYTMLDKTGGKRCTEGWKEYTYQEPVPSSISGAKAYLCDSKGCTVKV